MKENHIIVNAKEQGKTIGDLFGIFLEDLNHTADGGLYAELVQNRSFEFLPIDNPAYHTLTAWSKIGDDKDVVLAVKEGDAVSKRNPHYLHMQCFKSNTGVRNVGFGRGMFLKAGEEYRFSCYVRSCDMDIVTMKVSLRNEQDEELDSREFQVNQTSWQKIVCVLSPQGNTSQGSLALVIEQGREAELDFVSLFPVNTFRNRTNGLRKDLAEALEELHPKFVRFPGGCLVHDGQLDENARDSLYRWKNTIGPLEERPARRNNWRYNQTLGLGYYEYFLLCEDIGAKPMPILPAAYDPHHQRAVPLDELEPWIQETLDLIEFANGDEDTTWGKVRAVLGHKELFGLEYIGIGNEEVGEGFRERFSYFVNRIREKYPNIKIIGSSGPFCAGSEYEKGWNCARENKADFVDEHYYMAPEWFISNVHRYDSFDENIPHVFLGEYASCFNTGKSALAEAAYMTALQNNCHAVKLACYAPLFCHKDYVNWKPDMIWFDNEKVCRSVNYQVQKLFMKHQGQELLPYTIKTEQKNTPILSLKERKQGDIYFWGNDAKVQFTEIEIYNEVTGEHKKYPNMEVSTDKIPLLLTSAAPQNFTLKCHAKEIEGKNGFRIYFAWKNEQNRMCWVLGGWENQDAALVEEINGKGSFLTQSQFSVEKGREYCLELHVTGNRIEGWIDNELFQYVELVPMEVEPLYLTVSKDNNDSDVIIKAVNLQSEPFAAQIEFPDLEDGDYTCENYVLLEADCEENPDFPEVETGKVVEKQQEVSLHKHQFKYEFASRSVTVIRLKGALVLK